MQIRTAITENTKEILKKLKIEPNDAAIPLLGIFSKEMSQYVKETSALLCSLQHYSQ
jgi:hypothetical protein